MISHKRGHKKKKKQGTEYMDLGFIGSTIWTVFPQQTPFRLRGRVQFLHATWQRVFLSTNDSKANSRCIISQGICDLCLARIIVR